VIPGLQRHFQWRDAARFTIDDYQRAVGTRVDDRRAFRGCPRRHGRRSPDRRRPRLNAKQQQARHDGHNRNAYPDRLRWKSLLGRLSGNITIGEIRNHAIKCEMVRAIGG